jgi:hypothetical protein
LSGAIGGEQVFVELAGATLLLDGLTEPYEAFLWEPGFAL